MQYITSVYIDSFLLKICIMQATLLWQKSKGSIRYLTLSP